MTGPTPATPADPMLVPDAVIRGAALALTVVVPAAVLQLLIDVPSVRWLLFAVILGGFGVGGHRAGGLASQRRSPTPQRRRWRRSWSPRGWLLP
jgi:hypothetical protein